MNLKKKRQGSYKITGDLPHSVNLGWTVRQDRVARFQQTTLGGREMCCNSCIPKPHSTPIKDHNRLFLLTDPSASEGQRLALTISNNKHSPACQRSDPCPFHPSVSLHCLRNLTWGARKEGSHDMTLALWDCRLYLSEVPSSRWVIQSWTVSTVRPGTWREWRWTESSMTFTFYAISWCQVAWVSHRGMTSLKEGLFCENPTPRCRHADCGPWAAMNVGQHETVTYLKHYEIFFPSIL